MIRIKESAIKPNEFAFFAELLRNGNIGVWKTDTVYGYFCRFDNERAIETIVSLKQRTQNAYFSLALSRWQSYRGWFRLNTHLECFLDRMLPGPFTFILNKGNFPPAPYFDAQTTVGIRQPAHNTTQYLSRLCGVPMITTSANLSGEGNAKGIYDIPGVRSESVAFVIDSGPLDNPIASAVIDLSQNEIHCLRMGSFPLIELNRIWAECADKDKMNL
jgi:tRNA threonylcarbamoyl adenosine modification protein (Sua5/YciO/YrdC/YwlC family)